MPCYHVEFHYTKDLRCDTEDQAWELLVEFADHRLHHEGPYTVTEIPCTDDIDDYGTEEEK